MENETPPPLPNAAPPIVEMTFEKRSLSKSEVPVYRVYRDAKDFVTVNALNAHDAFSKAAIPAPFRIQREDPANRVLLDHKMFEDLLAGPAIVAEVAPEVAAAPVAPAAEAPAQPTA